MTVGRGALDERSVALSGIGSNSSSAAIRVTMPTIASSGANTRMPNSQRQGGEAAKAQPPAP